MDATLARFGTVPFSHGALLPLLKDYRRPNDKIAEWLRQGVLLPLKRGHYMLGGRARAQPAAGGQPPVRPLLRLAGVCAGLARADPPERVHEITSIGLC